MLRVFSQFDLVLNMNPFHILNSGEDAGADQLSNPSDPPPEDGPSGASVRRSARPRRPKLGVSAKQTTQSPRPAGSQLTPECDEWQRRPHTARLPVGHAAKAPEPGRRQRVNGRAPPRRTVYNDVHPLAHSPADGHVVASVPLLSCLPARDLLKRAQLSAEADAEWLGRRPFIMDIILDARPPVSAYSEDVLMDAIERSHAFVRATEREYVFTDRYSLDTYWTEQAALWRGVADEAMRYPSAKRFRISAERSTVSEDDDMQSMSADDSGDAWTSPMTPFSNLPSHSCGESPMDEIMSVSSTWDSDDDSSVNSPEPSRRLDIPGPSHCDSFVPP